ncbi:MAG: YbaB/EbfC family nucleoid-associated protein [Rickettsiales bacterium]
MMNVQKMMQQAQAMQKKMEQLQEEIARREFDGVSGGGMVKVRINGKGEALSVELDPSLMNKDEKDVAEDLIAAAFNNAKKEADDATSHAMRQAMGGMGLPAGMKLPF